MKISVITVCRNAARTLDLCVRSVAAQEGAEIEYIVVDGASTDGTLEVLHTHRDFISVLVSEPDNGLYDAMNKGLRLATGDVIGFLNADDVLATRHTIAKVARTFGSRNADVVFGDVEVYGKSGRLARVYSGDIFHPTKMASGILPPHPSFYARRRTLAAVGGFDTSFKIAADFDLMIRVFSLQRPIWVYLPYTIVRMRSGGLSNRGLHSYVTISHELRRACNNSNLRPNNFAIEFRAIRKVPEITRALTRRLTGVASVMDS